MQGPKVFHFLRQPESVWVTPERQIELAEALAQRM
jgi:hypothetical protein